MKNYIITVNGNAYDVQVEEAGAGSADDCVTPIAVRGITVRLGVVSGAGAVVTGFRGARGLYSPFIMC